MDRLNRACFKEGEERRKNSKEFSAETKKEMSCNATSLSFGLGFRTPKFASPFLPSPLRLSSFSTQWQPNALSIEAKAGTRRVDRTARHSRIRKKVKKLYFFLFFSFYFYSNCNFMLCSHIPTANQNCKRNLTRPSDKTCYFSYPSSSSSIPIFLALACLLGKGNWTTDHG